MNKSTDWKAKYQGALGELEAKESDWHSIEEILRKSVGRLCIAGRGHDNRLDKQLKLIQDLSRKKKDLRLPEALEKLADIVGSLDDTSDAPAQKPGTDAATVLGELLTKLKFDSEQQSDLDRIGADLLKTISEGQDTDQINRQLARLSTLINRNINDDKPVDHGAEIIFRLVSLLALDEDRRGQIEPQQPGNKSITDVELKSLARIINSQLNISEPKDPGIASAITSLLEKLAEVQGAPLSIGKIQSRIADGVADEQWHRILDEISASISQTLEQLRQEKQALEALIIKITAQISEITQFIAENHEDHLSDHQETLSMQQLMQEGVAKIEGDVNSAQDIDQLKTAIAGNITLIREGVERFVDGIKSRHTAIEVRNEKLTRHISSMEKETSQLQKKLKESSEKLLRDTLTGAGSRLAYDEQITLELARSKRYGSSFSYAILDIDNFKKINDKYGHMVGDKALKIIALVMMKQIRKSDRIYRVGGEEFVVLATNTELSNAETLVQKIRLAVAKSGFRYKQERIILTLSAGITEAIEDDVAQSIYERADSALYRAKNSGRNRQCVA